MENPLRFSSNGKLLITGEYIVLDGALAFAVPTVPGQSMSIFSSKANAGTMVWKSLEKGKLWFETTFSLVDFRIISSSDQLKSEFLVNLIQKAFFLTGKKEHFLSNSFEIETNLEFPINWGLGSSSSLVVNISNWFEIDSFQLQNCSIGGSGYDVACARSDTPILYQLQNNLPVIQPVSFNPDFLDWLFLVYSGKKQKSSSEIENYRKKKVTSDKIESGTMLTKELLNAKKLNRFQNILSEHENLIASILQRQPVQEEFFNDFDGTIKSLGAWGGDFLLTATQMSKEKVSSYFKRKGLEVVIPFRELVKI